MHDSQVNVDPDLHVRLLVATEAGGGTATWPILKSLGERRALSAHCLTRA